MKKCAVGGIAAVAVALFVVCPLLLWAEVSLAGTEARQQFFPLIGLSAGFFLFESLTFWFYPAVSQSRPRASLNILLAIKMVRLALSLLAFVLYAVLCGQNLLLFSVNLLSIYIICMVAGTIFVAATNKK